MPNEGLVSCAPQSGTLQFRHQEEENMTYMTRISLIAVLAASAGSIANAQGGPQLTHIEGAQFQDIQSMDTPGVNAWLEDVTGTAAGAERPMTCAFFRIAKSDEPLVYDYDYDEVKIILDGVITVSDGTNTVDAKKGDVLLLPNGAHITFTTDTEGTAFVCGARDAGTA